MLSKADSVRLYKIRKAISELSSKEGRGTELVSLYIPPKKPLHEVIAYLRNEWGTAGNIKSDTTRNHVQDALTKTMQRLKLYRETPETGLVIFSGALPTNGPGSEVIRMNEIVPPKPVNTFLYTCDDHFHVEFLKDMLKAEKVYGILSLDSNEVGIGILSGDRLDVEDVMTSGISGKTRKGGQCVSADTIVQMEDGRLVPISSASPGGRIASYNFVDYSGGTYQITDTFTLVPQEYYEIVSERPMMRISATGEHRFFALSGDRVTTVEASRLKPGDKILVSRRLPEPAEPVTDTLFPAEYTYSVSAEGRRMLKGLRTGRHLSQSALARAVGLYQTEVSQLERGERDLRWEKLREVIRFLYQDVDGFLGAHVKVTRTLPEHFTDGLLQLLGYIAGDGSVWDNRVALYEYRAGVAQAYSDLAKTVLSLERVPIRSMDKTHQRGSFARHRYLETRIYSKAFADALRQHYPGLISTSGREIPEQIQRLDGAHLAHFLRGLFDAEGYVRQGRRIGIAMKSGLLIKQLQLLLLRFGIVSSYSTSVNGYRSTMHRLDISDYDSLETFHHRIGFSAEDKQGRLSEGLKKGRSQSYLSTPVVGSWVDERAKELGIRRRQFHGVTNFFQDQRGVSRQVFRRVVSAFEDELAVARRSNAPTARLQLLEETVSRLSMIERSDLLLVRIKKVELVKNGGETRFVDIELPSTRSFVGNGFVLHNSARRYERGREMELTYFFNRVAEHVTRIFITDNNVNGVIVGGPGPTKDNFLKGGYLDYRLQKNVLEVIDTSYSGREGIREIAEKAADKLQNVRFIEERKLVQKFLGEINRPNGLAVYGLPKIIDALNKSNIETMLISDDINITKISMACKNCHTVKERVVENQKKMQTMQEMLSEPCTNCGATDYDEDESDVVDMLEEKAMEIGARVEMISSGTEEGAMLRSFGGAAGFLRYRT
ncbi:MAG: LAGLIDADG family homing endonuclease [Nitrososphaerales archaeon]